VILRFLAVVAAALALAGPAMACAQPRTSLAYLEGQVMCPTCHTTLDQSDAAIAKRIEAFIRVRIAAGDTKQEIIQKLVAQFGPAILAAPTHKGFDLLAWWLPFVGVSIGGTYVTFTIWRWRNEPVIDEGDEGEDAFSLEETLVSTHSEL
jgi:cytochrome c-type biogenesis protein CcmH